MTWKMENRKINIQPTNVQTNEMTIINAFGLRLKSG